MNPKKTVPLAVTLAPAIAVAPAVIICGAVVLGIAYLIKGHLKSGAEKQPETGPAKPEADTNASRKLAESAAVREIPVKLSPSVPAKPVPVTLGAMSPVPAQPAAKKIISRADLAAIFENGKRSMSRNDAVAVLKRLGFGKTAAYSATTPDGRFSAWLIFAPDGIISWANGQTDK